MPTHSPTMPSTMRPLINPPTLVEYKGVRFLIVDAPSNNSLPLYIKVSKLTWIIAHDFFIGSLLTLSFHLSRNLNGGMWQM